MQRPMKMPVMMLSNAFMMISNDEGYECPESPSLMFLNGNDMRPKACPIS